MIEFNKIFGVGMSKTGTSSLEDCFRELGLLPHKRFDRRLKDLVRAGGDLETVFREAEGYRSFQDAPWYLLYRELDQRFPGSKFVLTQRKDAETHARSAWAHAVRKGNREGGPTDEYLEAKARTYVEHNQAVIDYFRDRPGDLLVVCWEDGDGWESLCGFLGVEVPDAPFPHRKKADEHLAAKSLGQRLKKRFSRWLRGGSNGASAC